MSGHPWWAWVLALVAGAAGALLRTALVRSLARRDLPVGVLVSNVAASAVGGVVVGVRSGLDAVWVLVLVGGFCGGLSTLSTLAADTVELWLEGRPDLALRSVALNVVLGVGAAWAAFHVVS